MSEWMVEIDGTVEPHATREAAESVYYAVECERSKALRNPQGRAVCAEVKIPAPGQEPSLGELAALGLPVAQHPGGALGTLRKYGGRWRATT